eukprot:3997209-Karenia_brevis.AAC.1
MIPVTVGCPNTRHSLAAQPFAHGAKQVTLEQQIDDGWSVRVTKEKDIYNRKELFGLLFTDRPTTASEHRTWCLAVISKLGGFDMSVKN